MAKNGDKTEHKKPGRKPIELDLAEVERLASRGLGPTQIARALGVSWDTLNRNRKRSAEFADIIERGKVRGIQMVSDALLDSATAGSVPAQIFYLKNRDGDNWKDRTDIAVATKVSISAALDAARARAVPNADPTGKVIDHEPTKIAETSEKMDVTEDKSN